MRTSCRQALETIVIPTADAPVLPQSEANICSQTSVSFRNSAQPLLFGPRLGQHTHETLRDKLQVAIVSAAGDHLITPSLDETSVVYGSAFMISYRGGREPPPPH